MALQVCGDGVEEKTHTGGERHSGDRAATSSHLDSLGKGMLNWVPQAKAKVHLPCLCAQHQQGQGDQDSELRVLYHTNSYCKDLQPKPGKYGCRLVENML